MLTIRKSLRWRRKPAVAFYIWDRYACEPCISPISAEELLEHPLNYERLEMLVTVGKSRNEVSFPLKPWIYTRSRERLSFLGGKAGGIGVIDLAERDSWSYPVVSDIVEAFDRSSMASSLANRWWAVQKALAPPPRVVDHVPEAVGHVNGHTTGHDSA
jgi:hypothetical protein